MSQEKKHLQPDIDLDALALLALSDARATPPGPQRSEAMKRAGILRNCGQAWIGFSEARTARQNRLRPSGRRRKRGNGHANSRAMQRLCSRISAPRAAS